MSKDFVSDSSDEEVEGPYASPPRAKKASAVHEQEQHSEDSDVGQSSEIVTAVTASGDEGSSESGNVNEANSRSEKQIKPQIRRKAPSNRPQQSA